VLDGLVTVLTDLPAGERVPLSEVRARPHRWVSRPRLVEVFTDLDLLHDDSAPAIRSWIDRVTGSFAPGYITPVRQWLLVLLDGDTRSRSRSTSSIYVYFGCIRPFLDDWAAGYDHLREVRPLALHDGGHRFNSTRRSPPDRIALVSTLTTRRVVHGARPVPPAVPLMEAHRAGPETADHCSPAPPAA
jgi:hypothetical protein